MANKHYVYNCLRAYSRSEVHSLSMNVCQVYFMSHYIPPPDSPGKNQTGYKTGDWKAKCVKRVLVESKLAKMEFTLVGVFLVLCTLCHVYAAQSKDVCLLQLDEGSCRGDITRFYYNTLTQKCEEFSYGGCQGNANNFMSFHECQKTCWKIPKIPQICRFQKEVGPCRALHLRYHFNMTTMQCQPFYYGGCQGNNNRFDDVQSCMEYCRPHKTTPVLCQGPLDIGQCTASIPRYYYNSVTRACEQFLYSGCGGSSNNFVTKHSCMDVCSKRGRPWKPKNQGNRPNRKKAINIMLY